MRNLLIILSIVILSACGKDDPAPVPVPAPVAADLLFPAQSETCTSGISVSATESKLSFQWKASVNADRYELHLKNLLTSTTTIHASDVTSLELSLKKGTPYSWFVISKSSKSPVTAKSSVWKFYNSGPGVISYAPFPAEITSPTL